MRTLVLLLTIAIANPALACHRFSIWRYPQPQRCAVAPDRTWYVEFVLPEATPSPEAPKQPEADIPLPSLEGMEFPPDATGEVGERLKGVGLLRQLRRTN